VLALLLVGCASRTGAAAPTATPASACAAILPGAAPANLNDTGFPLPLTFPRGSVATDAVTTSSGTGVFAIHTFQLCAPRTTPAAAQAYLDARLPTIDHGWHEWPYFPDAQGLMQPCAMRCWYDARSIDKPLIAPPYYLVFDQFAAAGHGAVTYRGRYAAPPDFPDCMGNFAGSPTPNFHYFLPDATRTVPVPPLTFMAPDDAAGARAYELCSPGTAASVAAFMRHALPATGWHQVGQDARCVYQDECWIQGMNALSWNVADSGPSAWHIAWHAAS
jgi:hypothetical protein